MVGCGNIASVARAAMVDDPGDASSLPKLVASSYANGDRDITIQPGTYTIKGNGHALFNLHGWSNATIHADGVTLIAENGSVSRALFEMEHCTGVTIEGATLSQTHMTAYQGRVIAIHDHPHGKATCIWRPDAGYPIPPASAKTFPYGPNIVDGATRMLKLNNGDYGNEPMKALGDGTYRITFHDSKLKFAVGDFLVGRFGDRNGEAPFKVHLVDCRNCTIENITMSRNGFAPIREEGGGGNHYLHCTWTMGPRPAGTTEAPVVTNAADGFHSTGTNPGPDIEGCVMRGVFLDDCFAIHGEFAAITAASGNTLTLGKSGGGLQVGQQARVCDAHGFFAQANVTAIKQQRDHSVIVTLDKPINAPAGSKVNNPLSDGPGYKIIGCTLGNVRSRGILVKADNGLIKDNVIDGCVMSAISVGPEYYWNEAGYVEHLLIEGNVLHNDGKNYSAPVVLIHGDGAMGNRHITIERNQFIASYSSCMSINWAKDVTAKYNSITGPSAAAAGTIDHPIVISNSDGISLVHNPITNAAVYKSPQVLPGKNVVNLTGDNVTSNQ